jgi:hypothetical protein
LALAGIPHTSGWLGILSLAYHTTDAGLRFLGCFMDARI